MRRLWSTFRGLIRRTPLIVSTLLGTILLIVGVWSYFSPVYLEWHIGTKNTFYTYDSDGLLRLTWLRYREPVKIRPTWQDVIWKEVNGQRHIDKILPTMSYRRVSFENSQGRINQAAGIGHGTPSELHQQLGSWFRAFFEFRWFMPFGANVTDFFRTFVRVPFWVVVPILYVYPIAVIFGKPARRRRRRRRGLCVDCAYDLRGNASGRCPECGNPTDSKIGPA